MRRFYDLHTALKQPLAVEALYLDRNRLKELPAQILAFKNLRLLHLSGNELEQLPEWLPLFPNLQTLEVDNNQLTSLPDTLSHCPALQVLDLRVNHLVQIKELQLPPGLIQLDLSENHLQKLNLQQPFLKLQTLLLNHNQLSSFPMLKNIPQLKNLILFRNKIKKGPQDWDTIQGLEKLNLGRNRLVNIPEAIGLLTQLKYLDLSHNKIEELPAAIAKCIHLRKVNLAGNRLHKIPYTFSHLAWLVDLNLSKNNFKEIPGGLQQLKRLDRLDLSRNQVNSKIAFQSPATLRILDLSHNPIQIIHSLPIQLKQLFLRKTHLKKAAFLSKIERLAVLDLSLNTLETLPAALFHLSQLKKLKGLLAPTPNKHLLQLLQSQLSAREKKQLYFFWQTGAIPSQAILLKGLSLSLSGLSKKINTELLQETRKTHEDLPEIVKKITILGRLTSSKVSMKVGLKNAGISTSADSPWVVLGRGPYPTLQTDGKRCFFNEAQLLAFLNQKNQPVTPPLSQNQNLKLERLLLHPNPRQVKMALLLLKTHPIESHLLPALITAWKLQTAPKLKRELSELVQQNQHPDYERLRNSRLPFSNQEDLDNKGQLLLEWLENAGLKSSEYAHWNNYFQK